jgi:hypothetical protein
MAEAVIPAIITAGASIWGASKQSSTSKDIAKLQLDTSNRVAEIDAESSRQQLAFLKEQDRLDRLSKETDRKMTYDQWAAREDNLAPYRGLGKASSGTLGHLMGFTPGSQKMPNPRDQVPYVPLPKDEDIPSKPPWTQSNPSALHLMGFKSKPLPPAQSGPSAMSLASLAGVAPAAPDGTQSMEQGEAPAQTSTTPQGDVTLVWMEGPDGSRKQVPRFSVPYFEKMGAKVISGNPMMALTGTQTGVEA